ncbi:2-keto-4-pentenoate hydratase [Parasedimentitalea psychrophila]|uniref:2-keto-4-pentenoate hydratase n=1 Tax=Parasedimentitalea psychrophila TaxID=2997337 RepID=A0A9Y2P8Y6_9RHOB|nr:2-keto-4-pentenoate hydratase [Parasedimentitalea psychrophila]WIY27405.1 2-keto-4-pentenoate hydratase [Parasedimentitalea psychrophila]
MQMRNSEFNRADALAEELDHGRAGGVKPGPEFERDGQVTWEEAYQVQSILVKKYAPVAGFKVARKPGQPNIMAPIYSRDTYSSPVAVQTPPDELIGIELEIGFKVLSPLPAPNTENYLENLRACVAMVPVIEIVLTRLSDDPDCSPQLRLADNQLNGGLVVGQELRDWAAFDQPEVDAYLSFGDEVVLDGMASVPAGNAFESFRALAEMVGDHCGGLKPGHVVITGSLNGLPYIERGTPVRGEIRGLGEIAIDFPL